MKKIFSTVLICVLLLSAVLVLASCGNKIDSGRYIGSNGAIVEIDGKNFVITIDGEEYEYTYEINKDDGDSDKKVIYLTDSEGEELAPCYFEELDDGFQFNGVKYTKK